MVNRGGITLCSAVIVATDGSVDPTITGQKSISDVEKTGMVKTVVFVTVTPFAEDKTDVVNGGQVMVSTDGRGNGGKTRVQGGWHWTTGFAVCQIDGSM